MRHHAAAARCISSPPTSPSETLASALARSSFRSGEPAFFSWLGVTVYLTREANMATLRAVATCGAPGSELVFTYVDQIEFAEGGRRSRNHPNAQAVARIGEPFVSGFDPSKSKTISKAPVSIWSKTSTGAKWLNDTAGEGRSVVPVCHHAPRARASSLTVAQAQTSRRSSPAVSSSNPRPAATTNPAQAASASTIKSCKSCVAAR